MWHHAVPMNCFNYDEDAEERELNRRLREAQRAARKREIKRQIRELSGGLWI